MFGAITTCFFEGLGSIDLGKTLYERDRITVPVFEQEEDNRNCLVRVSTHLYNTEIEIDRFVAALEREKAS